MSQCLMLLDIVLYIVDRAETASEHDPKMKYATVVKYMNEKEVRGGISRCGYSIVLAFTPHHFLRLLKKVP